MAWDRDPHGAEITNVSLSVGVAAAVIVGGMFIGVMAAMPNLSPTWTGICCAGLVLVWGLLALGMNRAFTRPARAGPPHLATAPPFSAIPPGPPATTPRLPDACPHCGAALRPNASFCAACGSRVGPGT